MQISQIQKLFFRISISNIFSKLRQKYVNHPADDPRIFQILCEESVFVSDRIYFSKGCLAMNIASPKEKKRYPSFTAWL